MNWYISSSPKPKICPESLRTDGVKVLGWDMRFDQASTHWDGQWCVPSVDGQVEDIGHQMVTRKGDEHRWNSRATRAGQSHDRSPAFTVKYGQTPQAHAEDAPQNVEPATIQSWKIYKSDITKYGATPGCPGCKAIQSGTALQSHILNCRL